MQINLHDRRLLLFLLLLSTCLLVTYAKGGRGGSRGSGSRGSSGRVRNRPTYRPASRPSPRPAYRPSPKPAPKPTQKSQPAPPSPRPPAPEVVAKQPASNPNFKETSPVQGSADKQPAHNPNYKPDGSAPAGPPPPYSPAGHPAPSAPVGPPPPYQPNAPVGQPPPYGAPGQRPPYPQQPGGQPPYPAQPPPYSGHPGRPPAYPGQAAPYPQQPGGYPQQPGANRPYPVQPGYPGGYPQQPGMNRPYPVQPGINYPGGNRPQQPLGSNVWNPQSGMPAPAYTNYGGMPTGTNMYAKPHKQKGFLGSLMSLGHSKPKLGKQNKYYGGMPGGMAGGMAAGMAGGMAAGKMGRMGGTGSFLGKHGKSIAMMTILPYMAYKTIPMLFRPSLGFGFMPFFSPMPHFHHHHYGQGFNPGYAHYYDVYDNDYVGKCQRPLRNNHTEIRCKSTYNDIKCDAKCEDGFEFPSNIQLISNRCWHMTGIWRPRKNFPKCEPICDEECMNGGQCIRPGVCECPAEFRGDRCQFHFLDCDARTLTKGETHIGWVCSHSKNETVCRIRCKPPAEFESPAAEEYRCTREGEWTPNSLPRCVVKDKKDENPVAVK